MLGVLCAVLFLAGIFGSLWILTRPHGTQVEIVQDGAVLQQVDLTQAENQMIEVEYEGRIKEETADALLSELRMAADGRRIGYQNAVNYPGQRPVSRLLFEVRALRRRGRGN